MLASFHSFELPLATEEGGFEFDSIHGCCRFPAAWSTVRSRFLVPHPSPLIPFITCPVLLASVARPCPSLTWESRAGTCRHPVPSITHMEDSIAGPARLIRSEPPQHSQYLSVQPVIYLRLGELSTSSRTIPDFRFQHAPLGSPPRALGPGHHSRDGNVIRSLIPHPTLDFLSQACASIKPAYYVAPFPERREMNIGWFHERSGIHTAGPNPCLDIFAVEPGLSAVQLSDGFSEYYLHLPKHFLATPFPSPHGTSLL